MLQNENLNIAKVKSWSEHLGLTRPYSIAYKKVSSVENIFVYLETGNGLNGIGAGSPSAFVTGETIKNAISVLEGKLESLLTGKDIRQLNHLSRILERELPDTPAARAAVEMALYDIFTKYLKIPLVDMLGKEYRACPTSITIGIKHDLQDTLEEAAEYVGREFKIIKLKIGKSLEQDIITIKKLREKVGPEIKIRVDANQGYSAADLIEFFNKTKKENIELIEQPVKKDQTEKMLQVPDQIRQICAADESLINPLDALQMSHQPHPFGIFNIKLAKCGGIRSALHIANIAKLAGIDLMWGCMDESIVSITAALHVALASTATKYLDLDGSLDLARDIATGGFILTEGEMSVSDESGLGVHMLEKID
jgi:L-alanine-DL-glutamate epimerase-like enolase superfamily enzyme